MLTRSLPTTVSDLCRPSHSFAVLPVLWTLQCSYHFHQVDVHIWFVCGCMHALALALALAFAPKQPVTSTHPLKHVHHLTVVPDAKLYAADVPTEGVNVTTKIGEDLQIKAK